MIPIVKLSNISKSFGNLKANDRVDLTLFKGEIHSLVGSNGAGKSTLVKILYGMLRPDSGVIKIKGKETKFTHPRDAIAAKIGMVPQEILLAETQNALQNIILGSEPLKNGLIDIDNARIEISRILGEYDIDIDFTRPLSKMTVGEKQRILITRLLFRDSDIIILDEPTAALTPQESDKLFGILTSLKEHGSSIVFISHKIPEVLKISDRISVMRSGRMIGTVSGENPDRGRIME
ncbi:ATP-binding cassette domain-containing protein, partial [candidate division KSB1 bacterium]